MTITPIGNALKKRFQFVYKTILVGVTNVYKASCRMDLLSVLNVIKCYKCNYFIPLLRVRVNPIEMTDKIISIAFPTLSGRNDNSSADHLPRT